MSVGVGGTGVSVDVGGKGVLVGGGVFVLVCEAVNVNVAVGGMNVPVGVTLGVGVA